MPGLWGGASGPDYNPDAYDSRVGWAAEDDARDTARASREIDAQRHPDPDRPRSRWEQRRVEGELMWVVVEQLAPLPEDEAR